MRHSLPLRCRVFGHRWTWTPCPPHLVGWLYRCRRCPAELVL